MAVSTGSQLSALHEEIQKHGRKAINSDFALEIVGFESMWVLAKQCPWPVNTTGGEIPVPGPLGTESWQPQQTKTNLQGAIMFQETEAGKIDEMLMKLITQKGVFDARIYQGTPDNYLFYKPIKKAFFQIDNPDRDHENRGQVLTFNGTLFYHYYGETVAGSGSL